MEKQLQTQTKAAPQPAFTSVKTGILQSACACGQHTIVGEECAECHQKRDGMMQRAAVNSASVEAVPPIVHEVLSSSGQLLDTETRAFMEPRFGHDFSQVRVHTDERAAESARAVNARAYTVGRDIVFGTTRYAPETNEGKRLLAHELTHVLQQKSGAAQTRTEIGQQADMYEREADHVAEGVMSAQAHLSEQLPISTDIGRTIRLKIGEPLPVPQQMTQKPTSDPVPQWDQLPNYVQDQLGPRGYNQSWFQSHPAYLRLTVLNLYVKLRGLDLWQFVGREYSTGLGTLEFVSSDIDGLKSTLTAREDFTSPEESEEEWSSREMRASGQLHFKHFKGWSEKALVQAHIDQHGLLLRSKWWWLFPPIPLVEMGIHALTYESYKDVWGIRDILLDQGWDPAPLRGIASTPAATS